MLHWRHDLRAFEYPVMQVPHTLLDEQETQLLMEHWTHESFEELGMSVVVALLEQVWQMLADVQSVQLAMLHGMQALFESVNWGRQL